MTNQIPYQSLKLGTHPGLGHVLLFATSGEAGVNGEPFAVVYATSYEPPIKGPRFWENAEAGTPVIFGARIGKIQSGILPDQFFTVMFKDMNEAVSEVQRFFSLTETQKLLALNEYIPYEAPIHRIAKAVQVYTDTAQTLKFAPHVSPELLGGHLVDLTEKLMTEVHLTISPFSVKCSANTDYVRNTVQVAIREHVHMLYLAVEMLTKEVKSQQSARDTFTDAMASLNFAIACLSDFVGRNLSAEATAAEQKNLFIGQPSHSSPFGPRLNHKENNA